MPAMFCVANCCCRGRASEIPRRLTAKAPTERSSLLLRRAPSSDTLREIKHQILQLILPALWRTHPGLLDARPEFEPGILALLQCSALRRPALPGLQSREHDPERLQGPRCEMQHKRQRHFAFVTSSLVNMALAAFYFLAGIITA